MLELGISKSGLFVQISDNGNCIVVFRPVVHLLSCIRKSQANCHDNILHVFKIPCIAHKSNHQGFHSINQGIILML